MPTARRQAPAIAAPRAPQKTAPAEVLPEPIRRRLERQGLVPVNDRPGTGR